MQILSHFNTWEWIRIFGFLSYFYFTVGVAFGMLGRLSVVKRHKPLLYNLHMTAGWLGFITLIFHMLLLLIDQYEPYRLTALMLPFSASYHPILSGLGTIAFYLFFVVMISSDLWIKKMKRALWKKMHMFVFPAWLLSFLHGVLIGTDSSNTMIIALYSTTASFLLLILLLKVFEKQPSKAPATNRAK